MKEKGQIMAIDYGGKRSGIAVSDDMQLIASGLTTVNTVELIAWMQAYTKSHNVVQFVVGEPKRMHGVASELEVQIQTFLNRLEKAFPKVLIARMDERFTSKIAFDVMISSGLTKKKRRNKALVDQISATIILQDFMAGRSTT